MDLAGACNGILAGLVSVCAGADRYEPAVAAAVGAIGGLAQEGGHLLVRAMSIDDPLDAFAVHGCGGLVGVLVRPLLQKDGVDGDGLGVSCLAAVCIAGWAGSLSAVAFLLLRSFGWLRVPENDELAGVDSNQMAQRMYSRNG